MLSLLPIFRNKNKPNILCLGAHSDDIEIGAGATILRLIREYPAASIAWIVFSATAEREKEALSSADYILDKVNKTSVEIHKFRNCFFPYVGGDIKDAFEDLKTRCDPDLIFTHYRDDLHQDHRVIGELTWNTFRNHFILEYEIPKYDGGLDSPNVFCPVNEQILQEKLSVLDRFFVSQKKRSWFTNETFRSLMRLRGIECNAESGYAEAFYCNKIVV